MKKINIFILLTVVVSIILLPIIFNFLYLWNSNLARGETSDWFTLFGGIFSGLIGGILTYLGVRITIKHEKLEKEKDNKPKLEVLDQHFFLHEGATYEYRKPLNIVIQNLGGTIAKNIEAHLKFNNFDLLFEKAESEVGENVKKKLYSRKFQDPRSGKNRAVLTIENLSIDSKIQDFHYGNIAESYFRLIGNCVPITINYKASVSLKLPPDINGWFSYFWQHSRENVFDESIFDMTLELKYQSIEGKEYNQKFILSFKDLNLREIENGFSVRILTLRAEEIKV